MHAQSNLNAERHVLPKIQHTAIAMLEGFNAVSHISKPTPVLGTLMKLPGGIRQELLDCFTNRMNEKERFLSLFRSACSMVINANDLDAIRISKHQKIRSGKRTFNNEYTPLLEEYFEHNAYPCASDRLSLAKKTMMTPRQIEVWFQNHRNRAKKEGKTIKRSSSNEALELSLKSLETDMSSPQDSLSGDSVIEDSMASSSVDAFCCLAPPHAFPTCYPHNCANPFPNSNGIFKFAPPVWRRRPAVANPPPTPVNFDEFVEMFTKLNLEDCSSTVQTRRKTSLTKPWFAATVTITSPAPHPALLRRSCVSPLSQKVASPTSVPSTHTSLRSRSSSATAVSQPLQIATKPQKLAPLPRRTSTSSTLASSSPSLTDPIWSPLPVIQAQSPIITDDMFETFHEYINTNLQTRWNNPSTSRDKQGAFFSPYKSTLLPMTNFNYLEVQS